MAAPFDPEKRLALQWDARSRADHTEACRPLISTSACLETEAAKTQSSAIPGYS